MCMATSVWKMSSTKKKMCMAIGVSTMSQKYISKFYTFV